MSEAVSTRKPMKYQGVGTVDFEPLERVEEVRTALEAMGIQVGWAGSKHGYRKQPRKTRMDDNNWPAWRTGYAELRRTGDWYGRDPLWQKVWAEHLNWSFQGSTRLHEALKIMWALGQVEFREDRSLRRAGDGSNGFYRLTEVGRRQPILNPEALPERYEGRVGRFLDAYFGTSGGDQEGDPS